MALEKIINLFRKAPSGAGEGWIEVQTAGQLLGTQYRQGLIQTLYQMSSMPAGTFEQYVRAPIERYAVLVQLLPASESHHHAYQGGMLDHALEIMCYALRIRRKHLLPPGGRPEDQVSVGELWSSAVLYTALLHDIAKVLVDVEILLPDGSRWHLWNGPIPRPYRIRYRPGRDYHLHEAMGLAVCRDILGGKTLDWLFTDPQLFGLVMYALSGHPEKAGIIGEIVHQADKASTARALGGAMDASRLAAAPQQSLQRKLVEGLRHLIRSGKLPVNGTKGSSVYLTDEAVWLVSPRVPRELKAYLLEQGIGGIPSDESRLYDEMLAHGLISPTQSGQAVWSGCTVSIGDWSTSALHLLKASPSLIWGPDDERPEARARVQVPVPAETPVEAAEGPEPSVPTPSLEADEPPPVRETPEPPPVRETPAVALLAETLSEGEHITTTPMGAEDATDDTSALLPKANPAAESQADPSMGDDFVRWVREGLRTKALTVNHAKAMIHAVGGSWFFISPNIFKKYCVSQLGSDQHWERCQLSFQRLNLHVRENGKNIVTAMVNGPTGKTSKLKGFLIKRADLFGSPPADNIYLQLSINNKGG
ncbi:MobH family relaxase [Azotobacter vinelandii]|uniref:MobH family relaxase n=1 Tax=Azotobacter vinelandii TaxID=354 RepID=UPI00077496A8|nr:MobH family relaxase [Azotobacter vinelandii]